MKTKPTVVRISRKKWSRGVEMGNALLIGPLRRTRGVKLGTMCCLGFACRALGAKPSEIRDKTMPSSLEKRLHGLNLGFGIDTTFSQQAARINDDIEISDHERQKKLRKLAAENGFKFVFVP